MDRIYDILFASEFSKLFWTAVLSWVGAVLMGWAKDKRELRRRAASVEEAEVAEERDYEMRCLRTEADLETLDAYAERFGKKATNAVNALQEQLPLIVRAIAAVELSAHGAPRAEADAARQLAKDLAALTALIKYIFTDLEVEIKAHQIERPKYLERLNKRPVRPAVLAPLPPPPPEPEE